MRKLAAILLATPLLLASQATGSPYLSVSAAKKAIRRAEPHATLDGSCSRESHIQLVCRATEDITEGKWLGWEVSFLAYATLTKSGRIGVFNSVSGPNYRRSCECWVKAGSARKLRQQHRAVRGSHRAA